MDEFDALKSEASEKHHPEDDSESTSELDSDSEIVRLNRAEEEEEKSQSARGRSIPGTGDRDMMFKHSSHLSGSFQTVCFPFFYSHFFSFLLPLANGDVFF